MDDRKRLAEKMDQRRAWLRLKWRRVAERAVLDESTLYRARTNKIPLSTDIKAGIEQALEWEEGSVDAILADKEPTPKDPTPGNVQPMLRDKVEEALWAITELSEGMRWDHILAHRRRKESRGDDGASDDHRQSGS